jgi:hypothetical protein
VSISTIASVSERLHVLLSVFTFCLLYVVLSVPRFDFNLF